MKRYQVEKDPVQGKYKIVDTGLNLVIAWLDKKAPADRACKHINQNYESNLTKKA